MPRTKRNTFIVLAILGILAILIWSKNSNHFIPFDSQQWQASSPETDNETRYEMAKTLVGQDILRGKSRTEVISLLGKDGKGNYFKDWSMGYHLGTDHTYFNMDSAWLVLQFDKDDHVSNYQIISD